jgi:hypothetical protein
MPTITIKNLGSQAQYGGKAEGNDAVRNFTVTTNATGAVVGSDVATGVAIADVVRIGILRAGFRIDDALLAISTGWTASATGKIGFAYVDGVDSTAVPQDDDYFFAAGLALTTAARARMNNTAVFPVTLPKDAYIILTTAGAANAKVSRFDLTVYGEDRGAL